MGHISRFVGAKPYKITKPIRLVELFGGIGSQAKALFNLGKNFEHYRMCDFDRFAVDSYNAVHGTNFVPSDITQIRAADLGIVDTDLIDYIFTYSFPCQDLSVVGAGCGMSKGSGTRSGLLWEVERLLSEMDELPQILLMENVPQVVGKKHLRDFEQWQIFLDSLGYRSFGAVLNATGFGIPQNRERAFLVSVRGNYFYTFPRPFPLTLRLRDMLEDEVDAKYYLSDELISRFLYKDSGRALHDSDDGVIGTVYSNASEHFRRAPMRGVCNTLKANSSDVAVILDTEALKIREATKKGYVEAYAGDGVTLSYPSSNERRGRVFREGTQTILPSANSNGVVVEPPNGAIRVVGDLGFKYKSSGVVLGEDGVCSALTTMGGGNTEPKVLRGLKIRKLTPRECWRLMGFTDTDFDKAQSVNSNTQLYKQAGNSIVVNVLEAIFKQFFD